MHSRAFSDRMTSEGAKLVFLLIFMQLGVLFLASLGSPYLAFLLIIGLFLFFRMVFSVKTTLFVLSFYIISFPAYGWGKHYPFFKIFVSYPLVGVFIFLGALFWLTRIALQPQGRTYFTIQDTAVLAFLAFTVVSAFLGFVNGHPTKYILKELFFLGLYSVYFLAKDGIIERNWVKQFWILLVFATLVASVQFFLLALSEARAKELFLSRVVTRQPHLAQLVVPYLASFFIFPSSSRQKVFALILLIPILIMVFLGQQRGLWIGIPFSVVLLWVFSILKGRFSWRKIIKDILIVILFIACAISILLLLDKFFVESTVATFFIRIDSLLQLSKDPSALSRMAEINIALSQWKRNYLMGSGLGAPMYRVATRGTYDIVDNSYVFILWKAGLIGLFSYLTIILLFFKRGLAVYKRSKDLPTRRIVASSLAGFAGLMLIALTNSSLMLYRFVIIWAILFGSIEFLYKRLQRVELADA